MVWRKCRMVFGAYLRCRNVGVWFRREKWQWGTSTVSNRQVVGGGRFCCSFIIWGNSRSLICDSTVTICVTVTSTCTVCFLPSAPHHSSPNNFSLPWPLVVPPKCITSQSPSVLSSTLPSSASAQYHPYRPPFLSGSMNHLPETAVPDTPLAGLSFNPQISPIQTLLVPVMSGFSSQ